MMKPFRESVEAKNPWKPDIIAALLSDAMACRASDIHFEPMSEKSRIRLRIDGVVWDAAMIGHEEGKYLVNQLKALGDLDPIVRFTPRDAHAKFSNDRGAADLRICLAPCRNGETVNIRLLDPRRLERSMDELGLSGPTLETLENWLENVHGMFLAAGPTGSGKTTTIYSLLHELKFARNRIVSLEDPVEYEIDGIAQIQIDELHHLDFAEGVKSVLRLDPDFLMLGEIRDHASAISAVNAAISGRVLLSTVHSRDAVGALASLRNWGLPDHEVAEALVVVVAQRLVRRLCPSCKIEGAPSARDAAWMKSVQRPVPPAVWSARGCDQCNRIGFSGRTGLFELWRLADPDYELILNHADERSIKKSLAERGHRTLLDDAARKVAEGITTIDEVKRAVGAE